MPQRMPEGGMSHHLNVEPPYYSLETGRSVSAALTAVVTSTLESV